MKSLLDSIEAAQSTDSAKIVDALEHWSVMRGGLPSAYRPFDHQMTNRLLVCQVKPTITDKWDYFDVKAELLGDQAGVDAAFGSKAESACKIGPL
jgi:branched-chain amino acid transport system substrate-binding protein